MQSQSMNHQGMFNNSMNDNINDVGMYPPSGVGMMPAQGGANGMPQVDMNDAPINPEMPSGSVSQPIDPPSSGDNLQAVLVELRQPKTQELSQVFSIAASFAIPTFEVDPTYEPVPFAAPPDIISAEFDSEQEQTVLVKASVSIDRIAQLEALPNVVKVYLDTPIAPFNVMAPPVAVPDVEVLQKDEQLMMAGTCPIGASCDCSPGTPKGSMLDVAKYLGVDEIWAEGLRGEGIVVGVVDGGITAEGRPVKPGETPKRIPRVIGGFPTSDWGTTASGWGEHGNMCATDVLGMAPQARIYDLRLPAAGIAAVISQAIAAYQWAINQHRIDGTPHVLSNSWGIFQEAWDAVYARNPNHPFTRKVVEAIEEGIIVLFAAGNCGSTCPDGRCAADNGPGRSIWGANGHPRVITVGAVNRLEQFVGYSSQGPAALSPNKPDFCSITHFQGYFNSDSGTSAATPIAAGLVALLKQAAPHAEQDQIKAAMQSTAKDIGADGWDQHSGSGILQGKKALVALQNSWKNLGGYCLYGSALASWTTHRVDAFTIGMDGALYHKYTNNTNWSGWSSLGGYCISAPAAVSWGPNRIDAFVLGTDRAMYHKWWNGSGWSDWESLGGWCKHGVAAASWASNRLDTFVVGADNALYHKYWNGSAWSGWSSLGGYLISAPTAVSWGADRIDVLALGTDHAVWHRAWTGSAWTPWTSLGGYCLYAPAIASQKPNSLDVFAIGTDHALYQKSWNGSAWSDWVRIPSFCTSAPAAVASSSSSVDVTVIGGNDSLWHISRP
ncbi:MAG: S8 family serine peptidase [Synechococcales bacterium]|nr:S8 family serine peptidase [Synechococcales bacterium]